MPSENDTLAPTGTEHSTLYVAVEVSRKGWVVGLKSPLGERIGLHSIGAADVESLKGLVEHHRAKAERGTDWQVRTVCCYEAGYEGFWLARWLDQAMAVETVVLDPASLLVNRMAKQRKTDRIDAKKMVRALLAHDRGDAAVLSSVRVPSVEEEDRKRLIRERRRLVKERTSHIVEQCDQGASQATRHLRARSPCQGLPGGVRRSEDRIWGGVPAESPAEDCADCRTAGGCHSADRGGRGRTQRGCAIRRVDQDCPCCHGQ